MDDSGQILYKVLSGLGGTDPDTQKNEDLLTPLSQLCRICALPNEYLIPIFEGEGQENSLADKIHSHLPIRVNSSDDYPDHVCYQCASTLLAFHDLVDCCKQANITLTARVQLGQSRKTFTKDANQSKLGDASQNNKERLLLGRPARPDSTEQSTKRKKLSFTSRTPKPPRLSKHSQEVVAPNPFKCSYCYRSYRDSDLLTSHLLDSHSELLFHCDVCGSYLDRKELIPHMSKHAEQYAEAEASRKAGLAPPPSQPLSSSVAPPPNDDAFSISSHSKDRFDPIPDSVFEAIKDTEEMSDSVGNVLPKVLEFSNPIAGTAPRDPPTPVTVAVSKPSAIVCPICSKEFRLPSSYYYHKKHFHEGVKEHTCGVCGRHFAVKSALTAHLTLHTGDKPYSCPQCSKQFRSKASVYIHYKNIHCESKKFTCTTCSRSFRWKQKLLRHIASHTKDKKYFCPTCNKGFAVKYDLTRHVKLHVDAKLHVCDKCGTNFSQARYLKIHTQKKHLVT